MALMSMRAYARHRGVSPEAVSKAVRTGRISTVDDSGVRKIDSERADAEWERNTAINKKTTPTIAEKAAAEASPPQDPDTGGSQSTGASYHKSRALKEAYEARLKGLEYQERLGALIDRDKVRLSAFKTAKAVRDSILNVPNDLAAILAAETDPKKVHFLLLKALTEALEELSRVQPTE